MVHSEIGRTPAEAIAEVERYPLDPEVAKDLFLVEERRKVDKKDRCVQVMGGKFLCESFLRDQWVRVRYDPNDLPQKAVMAGQPPLARQSLAPAL